jgi:hypothetical protein
VAMMMEVRMIGSIGASFETFRRVLLATIRHELVACCLDAGCTIVLRRQVLLQAG